jgi:hypothetical protein
MTTASMAAEKIRDGFGAANFVCNHAAIKLTIVPANVATAAIQKLFRNGGENLLDLAVVNKNRSARNLLCGGIDDLCVLQQQILAETLHSEG